MLSSYLKQLQKAFDMSEEPYELAFIHIRDTIKTGGTIFLCGNGGSAATANHFGNDLSKLVAHAIGRKVRVVSLCADPVMLTTLGNDCGYEAVFREQLHNLAKPGDLLIAFSGSGTSPNVVRAVELCQRENIYTIGFTGHLTSASYRPNILAELSDCPVVIPDESMQRIEDMHLILTHALCYDLIDALPPDVERI